MKIKCFYVHKNGNFFWMNAETLSTKEGFDILLSETDPRPIEEAERLALMPKSESKPEPKTEKPKPAPRKRTVKKTTS